MVKVRILGQKGDTQVEMTTEELRGKLAERYYWVVDEETKKVIDALAVKENMTIALIPVARGG